LGDRSPSEFAAEFLGSGPGASSNEPRNSSPGLDQGRGQAQSDPCYGCKPVQGPGIKVLRLPRSTR
jgi:hypothetical protein